MPCVFKSQMLRIFLALSVCLQPVNALAEYLSHQLVNNELVVTGIGADGKAQTVRLQAFNQTAIAATFDSEHHVKLPSYAIAEQASATQAKLEETAQALSFDAGELKAVINKASFSIDFYRQDERLLSQQRYRESSETLAFDFAISKQEKLLGGGQRILGMDRRGHKLPLYNKAHYGYTTESKQMYYGLPAVMSSKKYILLFDNSATGEMDLDSSGTNTLSFSAVDGRASYIVVAGENYPNLIHNYVNLTGKQPMPPRWALGNFASRFGYRTQQEVLDTAAKFKKQDMPLDAIVLDLYWFGKDVQGHMGNLDWDREAFPSPEHMAATLAEQGVNTIVITEPFILSTSKQWQSATDANALAENEFGKPYQFDFYFGNTGLVDVFNQQGKQWFAKPYHQLAKQGITGWWGDLGEPEVQPDDILHRLDDGTQVRGDAIHNVYGHKWAEMVFEQSQEFAPNQRPLIMMRSGFVGSQRYGMIPWTGDVSRSWGGLKPQVELSLQMSLLGLAYTHSDLGGFAGGEKFDAEMYTRWLQYGAFQPVYRPHAQEAIAPEPVFHDPDTQNKVRKFIKLRYQLLPYNYTLAYENSQTGMPLMRPLMFEDEKNLALVAEKDSYLWGDAFLVTPITEPNISSTQVHLPKGYWFDFWTGKLVSGGGFVDYPVTGDTIPVFVRAGSFVPMAEPMSNTKAYNNEALALHYYYHSSALQSSGQLYEDDGISLNSIEEKAYHLSTFQAKHDAQQLNFTFKQNGKGYVGGAKNKQIHFHLHHVDRQVNNVVIDGKTLPRIHSEQGLWLATAGYYLGNNNTVTLKFDWSGKPLNINIQ